MTPEERQLITDLFERMRGYDTPEKDRDAERLISQSVRANPDAPYLLVQSVLVQEQALQQANERMQDLEQRVRELEGPPGRSSGGFLGGGRGASRGGSVPQVGARATPLPYGSETRSSPWGGQSQGAASPPPGAPAQGGGGGGFMRTALSAAAGVAGGMLLADGIRNMMGGGAAHAGSPGNPSSEAKYADADRAQDAEQDADENQDAVQDAADDSSDFDGGGEMDI